MLPEIGVFLESELVDLRARLKRSANIYRREKAKMQILEKKAFIYQDIIKSKPLMQFDSDFLKFKQGKLLNLKKKFFWLWFCYIEPISMRAFSILFLGLSIIIVWSESTFQFYSAKLSIPQIFLENGRSDFSVEVIKVKP
jgi:hypothetical protein